MGGYAAPDVVLAGQPDLQRRGDMRDRQPGLTITLRPREDSRCAPQHLVLWRTYIFL